MAPLSEQLEALVQLQDIDLMLREVRDPEIAHEEERLGFAIENVDHLERARRKIAGRIDEGLLQTYERMSRRFVRVIVMVERSVCQGCRMSLPTSTAKNTSSLAIENCENCGRILYRS